MTEGLAEVTPLPGSAAGSVVWRRHGQLNVTVIVKATFAFAPDAEMTESDPQEILRAEVHHGLSPARSVRFSSDLSPYLACVDVLFTGHAYAPPEGGPVHMVPVRLAIHGASGVILDKALIVQDKRGFQRLPVVYERAFTGPDLRDNPFGVDADAAAVIDPVDPSRPAGFGPIGRAWHARKRLLGATPRKVLEGPIVEIPEPFDWAYFQSAPPDQQLSSLRGDEWILLEGLHPTLPRLWTRLPGVRAEARVHGLSAFGMNEGQRLQLHADTLRIDGDEERCTVVWRRSFAVSDEAALSAARIVAGIERPGASTVWAEPPSQRQVVAAAPAAPSSSLTGTVMMRGPTDTAPPPKAEGSPIPPVEVAIEEPVTDEMTFVEPDVREDDERTERTILPFTPGESHLTSGVRPPLPSVPEEPQFGTLMLAPEDEAAAGSKPALPFHDGPASDPKPRAPAEFFHDGAASDPKPRAPAEPFGPLATAAAPTPADELSRVVSPPGPAGSPPILNPTTTLFTPEDAVVKATLPFRGSTRAAEVARPPGPAIPGAPWSSEHAPLAPAPLTGHATLVLSDVLPTHRPEAAIPRAIEPLGLGRHPGLGLAEPSSAPGLGLRPGLHSAEPSSAPDLGLRPVLHSAEPSSASLEALPPEAPPSSPAHKAPSPAPVTDEAVSIEAFAAITAELRERSTPRSEVLGAHGISEARWTAAEKHWTEALAVEAKRGERALLDAHDDAFVKAWQAIRGPFEIADYARLTLAAERGNLAATLEDAGIPRTLWMRLKRTFGRRMAASPAFAARVKQALADGRRRH